MAGESFDASHGKKRKPVALVQEVCHEAHYLPLHTRNQDLFFIINSVVVQAEEEKPSPTIMMSKKNRKYASYSSILLPSFPPSLCPAIPFFRPPSIFAFLSTFPLSFSYLLSRSILIFYFSLRIYEVIQRRKDRKQDENEKLLTKRQKIEKQEKQKNKQK